MKTLSSLSIEEVARRCTTSGDVEAWEEFVQRVHRLIAKVVFRTALRLGDGSNQTVDDLIQETYLKFCENNCRLLREFEYRHAAGFTGYLQMVAVNVVRDHFKARRSKKRGKEPSGSIEEAIEPPMKEGGEGSATAMERRMLIVEIQRHLDACLIGPDQQRNSRVFWLYYRVGLSASSIAGLPGVGLSTKGVESLVLRITRQLRERMTSSNREPHSTRGADGEGVLPAESF